LQLKGEEEWPLNCGVDGQVDLLDKDNKCRKCNDLKKKQVVTAFLQKKNKILVLRRSDKVRSYPGRWSGVSGYLEGDEPLERAKKEIQQETGSVTKLISRGKSMLVRDGDNLWEVFPFLFEAKGNIRLNWENTEYRWVKPNELKSLKTVPKLWEVYKSVSDEK